MPATIRLQSEDFDAGAEARNLAAGRTDIGAVVTFSGICRGSEAGARAYVAPLGIGSPEDRLATSAEEAVAGFRGNSRPGSRLNLRRYCWRKN